MTAIPRRKRPGRGWSRELCHPAPLPRQSRGLRSQRRNRAIRIANSGARTAARLRLRTNGLVLAGRLPMILRQPRSDLARIAPYSRPSTTERRRAAHVFAAATAWIVTTVGDPSRGFPPRPAKMTLRRAKYWSVTAKAYDTPKRGAHRTWQSGDHNKVTRSIAQTVGARR